MLLDLTVSYRPVIGFAPECTVCGLPVLRYGRMVHDGRPHGMPAAMVPAKTCHGHAVRVA